MDGIDKLREITARARRIVFFGGGEMRVKAVTYSGYQWLDLRRLWDTGHENKGGFVLFDITE